LYEDEKQAKAKKKERKEQLGGLVDQEILNRVSKRSNVSIVPRNEINATKLDSSFISRESTPNDSTPPDSPFNQRLSPGVRSTSPILSCKSIS
jgi:hypothetical protein